jgi:alpha-N-acetylglucosamine transferase
MDELFFMPPCPIAMPRAYWLLKSKPPKKILATHVMVIQPSAIEFSRIEKLINTAKPDEFDMELINKLYLNSAAVLPHRPYALLTAEFREKDHKVYLGSDVEEWDPKGVLEEAKFVHFSDWPVQKPWLDVDDLEGLRKEHQPKCKKGKGGMMDCEDKEVWNGLYKEFRMRREVSNWCV